MSATYFHDCTKDDGTLITVEFAFSASSPTTYSPHSGACGGDPCEVDIVSVFPRGDEQYDRLVEEALKLQSVSPLLMSSDNRDRLQELDQEIAARDAKVALTDAESERITDWIAEHHQPDEAEDDFLF